MASQLVHNISNMRRTSVSPQAFTIGQIVIRPGKHAWIPEESLNSKIRALHGRAIWIGNLPIHLIEKPLAPAPEPTSMDREQVSSYLKGLSLEELQELNKSVTPSFTFSETAPKRRYVYRLTAACFSEDIMLEPSAFFWLGRWTKASNGDYVEK